MPGHLSWKSRQGRQSEPQTAASRACCVCTCTCTQSRRSCWILYRCSATLWQSQQTSENQKDEKTSLSHSDQDVKEGGMFCTDFQGQLVTPSGGCKSDKCKEQDSLTHKSSQFCEYRKILTVQSGNESTSLERLCIIVFSSP